MMSAAGGGSADYIWALERSNQYGAYIYLLSPDLDSVEATYQLPSTYAISGSSAVQDCAADADGSVWFQAQTTDYARYAARMTLDGTFHVDTTTNIGLSSVYTTEDTIFYHGNNKDYISTYDYGTSTLQGQRTDHNITGGLPGGYRCLTYCMDNDILIVGGNNTSGTDYIVALDWSGTPAILGSEKNSGGSGGWMKGDYQNLVEMGGSGNGKFWTNNQYRGDSTQYSVVNPSSGLGSFVNVYNHQEYAYAGFTILSKPGYGIIGSYYADNGDNTILFQLLSNGGYVASHNTYWNALAPSGITMSAGTSASCASPVNECFYFNGNLGSGSYAKAGGDIFKISINSSNNQMVWDTSTKEELSNTWQSRSGGSSVTLCHSTPSSRRQTGP